MTAVPAEQVGRYGCPVCPRRFSELSTKKAHVRTHGPKPKRGK